MVDFLLDNTLGAWHAGKVLAANPRLAESAQSEEELRQAVALPGCPWKYLRFIQGEDGKWTPAAGTFDGWPKTVAELKCLDPCMGSGHFIVAIFERLVALRMAEEGLVRASRLWMPAMSFLEDTAAALLWLLAQRGGVYLVDGNRAGHSFYDIALALSAERHGGRFVIEPDDSFVYDQRMIDERVPVVQLEERLTTLRRV
jgi:hypothetical protein